MDLFQILTKDKHHKGRLGIIHTAHGPVHTPAFLPIGTKGSVKSVTAQELKFWGAEMILANTYHLWLRPGDALIHKAGGLHRFIGWDGPIFTDSGGFQVFSLGEKRVTSPLPSPISEREKGEVRNVKLTDAGVEFQNELDGALHTLTPELSIQIQSNLGSDIALVLDDVPALPASPDELARRGGPAVHRERIRKSLDLTLHWAKRAKIHHQKIKDQSLTPGQLLYGIVQGGDFEDLRKASVQGLQKIGFDGYGIGGLAVGEAPEVMYKMLSFTTPHLEEDKPRHLLGVGYPEQIIKAVSMGCDTFDCVIPTRNARHGELFVNKKGSNGSKGYEIIRITNEQFKEDFTPIDNTCGCYACLKHTRAYVRHLFMSGEPLGIRLATMHNLRFYLDLMEKIRRGIEFGSLQEMMEEG